MSVNTIETTKTNDFLTISIPLNEINPQEVEDFVTLVKSIVIAQKSKMNEQEAEKISDEIKAD